MIGLSSGVNSSNNVNISKKGLDQFQCQRKEIFEAANKVLLQDQRIGKSKNSACVNRYMELADLYLAPKL
jgi:hypothetical protein